MKQIVLLVFTIFFYHQNASSQILSIIGETEFSVMPNTDLSLDKIIIKPSKSFTLSNNYLSKIDQRSFSSGAQGSVYVFEKSVPFFSGTIELQSNSNSENLLIGVRSFQHSPWSKVDNSEFNTTGRFYTGNIVNSINIKEVSLVGTEKSDDFELVSNPIINSTVELKVFQPCILSISNTSGQILVKKQFSIGVHKMDVSNLAKSSYIISSSNKSVKFIY
jgi:hypothetical protein